jgi:hypothetical protein
LPSQQTVKTGAQFGESGYDPGTVELHRRRFAWSVVATPMSQFSDLSKIFLDLDWAI